MCAYQTLSDRSQLESYLRRSPDLNLYHLGDLDDFFWPHTRWFARLRAGQIRALALFYTGEDPPVLLAIAHRNHEAMAALLADLVPDLPGRVYAHLSPGLIRHFKSRYETVHHGRHHKMNLVRPGDLDFWDTSQVIPLTSADQPRLEALYAAAYPETWFNPRMLETGTYVGIPDADGRLLSAGGVHVYSSRYRVAALGNIATLPEQRGRGLASLVTAGCCQRLLERVDLIGLNVRADNAPAIRAYQKVGFEVVGNYDEWMMEGQRP